MWKNRSLTLIAVGAATVLLHPITGGQYWYVALVALAVGVLLYARASLPTVPAPQPEAMPFQFSRSHLAFMFVALIGFYFPLLRSITDIAFINTHIEYMVLAGCVGLMIVLTWRGNPLQISQDALILLVILLMALAIYIIRLGTHIPYMVDEWLFAVPVTRINERPPLLSQVTFFVPTPWIFTHWQWTVSTIAGNSLFSLRLVGALIGVFSVATAAFLGRELYGNRQQGYMAAFVLATFPPFIYFSRLALYNITDALFGFMAVALLLRAIRLHRTELFILAGVYIGLTHYFYEVGKVLFTPLIAALVLLMVVFNYRSIRTQWRGLTLTAIITAIVALPPWIANSIGQVQQLSRMDNVSIVFDPNIALNEKLWIMLGNFEESLTIITSNGETSIAYYGGEQGLVPSWMLPAFLLGVVVFAATPRKPVSLLFFLWTAAIILGNTPLDYIISARYVIYLPVAVFAIVAGYSYIAQLLPAR
ncbi:MAG: glycosyltransferase family 39 protein, partial [Chloroflexota bacterium]